MSLIGSEILAGASGQAGAAAYEIEQSLRFDGSSYLYWTPSSTGDQQTFTQSVWFKRAGLTTNDFLLFNQNNTANTSTYFIQIQKDPNDTLYFNQGLSGGLSRTYAYYRDPSAWYHILAAADYDNATASLRYRLYVNGVEASQNFIRAVSTTVTAWNNSTRAINIGRNDGSLYGQGYLAECQHIDGSALDPTSFGEFDDNGVWRPIEYSGSYTGNSFYLKFDPSAANGVGHDHSGLGNHFTASGFTTSGTGTDVMSDTPTTNYGTFNSVAPSGIALSEANLSLSFTNSGSETHSVPVTMGATSGKFYTEFKYTASGGGGSCGVGVFDLGTETNLEGYVSGWERIIYDQRGSVYDNLSSVASGLATTRTAGDIVGIAVDCDNGEVRFYVNGTLQHTETGLSYSAYGFLFEPNIGGSSNTCTVVFNGGQRAFEQTVPTGYSALNTSNLAAPDIADGSEYFTTLAYSGTSTTDDKVIKDSQENTWAPDFVWLKKRNSGANHMLYDRVRGASKSLRTNVTNAEVTGATNGDLTAFTPSGFTLNSGNDVNASGNTYVAWNWLAANGTSSNTDGSITSTVSANPTAGFSIVSYTGTGSTATVGHGLGVAPSMIIFKNRDDGGTYDYWSVYHSAYSPSSVLYLNTTDSLGSATSAFFDTAPTSTVFQVKTENKVNGSGDKHIAYCFAEVEGYSKFGSYTGNGPGTGSAYDGPFIYTGFTPKYFLYKTSSNNAQWQVVDSTRGGDAGENNPVSYYLVPNASDGEVPANSSNYGIDFCSNGIKIRTGNVYVNNSGWTYIYAAFAENPFGGSGVSPATAR